MSKRPKIGLALGSGGARGYCHIGVLRALKERGIEPDVIAGCSMGALVGAVYASGGLDAMETWARGLTRRKFLSLVDLRFTGGGLVEGREIMTLLRRLGVPARIEDLPLPFATIATDFETGTEVWMREGDLHAAVRSSVAMPGIITPLSHQGKWLLDGGMVNPVPVSLARALGADVVIAVNPNAKLDGTLWRASERTGGWNGVMQGYLPDPLKGLWPLSNTPKAQGPGYMDVLSTSIDIMTEHIARSRMAGEPPHVLLSADLSGMSVLDFHKAEPAIADGYRMVEEQSALLTRICGLG